MTHARTCVLICAALAVPSTAEAAEPAARTVTVIAAARVTLDRDLPKTDKAIGAAVEQARRRAVPLALDNARVQAGRLAEGAKLTLGAITGIEELVPPHFGHWAYGTDGTFGPGKFCGTVRQRSFRRLPSGRRVPTGKVRTRFTCRIPSEIQHTFKVTFAAA